MSKLEKRYSIIGFSSLIRTIDSISYYKFPKMPQLAHLQAGAMIILWVLTHFTVFCWHNALCTQGLCGCMTRLQAGWR